MRVEDLPLGDYEEPAGTILVGSQNKGTYLYVCQTAERMAIERKNAAQCGVQDMRDFVFVFDGKRYELSFEQLRDILAAMQKDAA